MRSSSTTTILRELHLHPARGRGGRRYRGAVYHRDGFHSLRSAFFGVVIARERVRVWRCVEETREREREREKWILFVSDMKRDTPTKTKSAKCLGYQKEDKEEEEEEDDDDFDKSSTLWTE